MKATDTHPDWKRTAYEVRDKAQAFFASYAAESRRPHCSDRDKGWIANLLLRAEEAGLYSPAPQ